MLSNSLPYKLRGQHRGDFRRSRKSRKNRLLPTRASEERAKPYKPDSSSHVCLAAVVPAVRRTGHPFVVSGLCRPSQMIEFVFAASAETIRSEASEISLLRSVGHMQDLAACALCNPVFSRSRRFTRLRSYGLL